MLNNKTITGAVYVSITASVIWTCLWEHRWQRYSYCVEIFSVFFEKLLSFGILYSSLYEWY